MNTAELKTIGTGTDAMIAQATEAMEAFRPMVAKVREHESLTVEANGIGKVSDARKGLKRLRVDIDKKRGELNKGALEFQRTVNSIAKELTKPVEEVEEILQAREDAHEAKKEAERRAKFEAEEAERLEAAREKQEKKQARVNQMIEAGVALDWAAAELTDESWHVWFGIAADEARIRKERAENEAQELRIRAAEMEKQRLADEAAMAEQRRAIEVEREALRLQQEEIHRAAEAKAKADREAAEYARSEVLKPEIEKAQKFAQMLSAEAAACLNTLGLPDWSDDALVWVKRCGQEIISLVEHR